MVVSEKVVCQNINYNGGQHTWLETVSCRAYHESAQENMKNLEILYFSQSLENNYKSISNTNTYIYSHSQVWIGNIHLNSIIHNYHYILGLLIILPTLLLSDCTPSPLQ